MHMWSSRKIMNETSSSFAIKYPTSPVIVPQPVEPLNSPANKLFLTHNPLKPSGLPHSTHPSMAPRWSKDTDWKFSAPKSIVTYPHPRECFGLDPFNKRTIRTTIANAPWLEPKGYKDHDLIRHHEHAGILPGCVAVEALESYDWKNHNIALLNDIRKGRSDADHRAAWEWIIYLWIRRTLSCHTIYESTGVETWAFRTEGEISLESAIGSSRTIIWREQVGMRQEALFFQQPILRAEFRFLWKGAITFWHTNIRWEHQVRNRLWYVAPHQMVEIGILNRGAREVQCVPILAPWHAVEIPRSCLAELPAVITYLDSYLHADAQSGSR